MSRGQALFWIVIEWSYVTEHFPVKFRWKKYFMVNFKPGDTRETIFLFISDTGGSEEKIRATCFIVNSALLKIIILSHLVIIVVEQWWRICESTLLPRTDNRGLCYERFSPRYSGFPLPSKTCIWLEQLWLSWPMRGSQSTRSPVRSSVN